MLYFLCSTGRDLACYIALDPGSPVPPAIPLFLHHALRWLPEGSNCFPRSPGALGSHSGSLRCLFLCYFLQSVLVFLESSRSLWSAWVSSDLSLVCCCCCCSVLFLSTYLTLDSLPTAVVCSQACLVSCHVTICTVPGRYRE